MAARRRNGEGSISLRKDGRWMARYYVTHPDGRRVRQQITGKDRDVVVKRLRDELYKADCGTPVYRDKTRTVRAMAEYFMEEIDPRQVRPTTAHVHRTMLEKHVIPILGHISLTSLKPEHVRHLIKTMEDSKVGVVSIKHSKDALSCILREAVKLEYIHRNVARLVDYKVEKQREIKVWNSEQAATFLSNSKEHRLYPLFAVMFQYGLRRGEIMGLTWNDIDFDTGTIHIRQQLLYVDNQRFVQPTKSKAGLRALPMTANIREILLCHKETESAQVYKDDFVFHTIKGNPLDPRALLTTFKYLAEAAGLPKLTLHEIRHTVATLLKDAGVSPRDAQMILGHSDITTTLRIYTHCSWESTQEALTRIAV